MDNKISTFNIEKFRLPDNYMESCPKPPKKSKKPRLNDNFLKGPIPIGWLMKASALPGKASQIGVALWYLSRAPKELHRHPCQWLAGAIPRQPQSEI